MSATNLDAIKRKYNFKEIAVATWRDPNHTSQTAFSGPGLSPNSPLVHSYKVNYDLLPQPTDDEESEGDFAEDEFEEDAPIDSHITQPIVELDIEDEDIKQASSESLPQDDTIESAEIGSIDQKDASNEDQPLEDLAVAASAMANDEEPATIEESKPPELETIQPEVSPISDKMSVTEEAQPDLEASDSVAESGKEPPLEAADDAHRPGDSSDERRVSFAPGTPDPKPTERKKKSAKGTKGKKKRISIPLDSLPPNVMAMIDDKLEGLLPPPPDMEVPTNDDGIAEDSLSDLTLRSQETMNESTSHAESKEDTSSTTAVPEAAPLEIVASVEPIDDVIAEAAEESPVDGSTVDPTEATDEPPVPQPFESGPNDASEDAASKPSEVEPADSSTTTEKTSKKKSSKSGKDKDKSKKKSSKTKPKEDPPPLTGLGIDMLPRLEPHGEYDQDDSASLPSEEKLEPCVESTYSTILEPTSVEVREDPQADIALVDDVPALVEDVTSKDVKFDDHEPVTTDAPAAEALTSADDHEHDVTSPPEADDSHTQIASIEDAPEPADKDTSATAAGESDMSKGPSEQDQALLEVAPSPADSGVEFDDGGVKDTDQDAAGKVIEAEISEPIDLTSSQPEDADQLAPTVPADEELPQNPPDAHTSTEESSGADPVKTEGEGSVGIDEQPPDEAASTVEDAVTATIVEDFVEETRESAEGDEAAEDHSASIADKVEDVEASYEPASIEPAPEDINPSQPDSAAAVTVVVPDDNSAVAKDQHTIQPEVENLDRSIDREPLDALATQAPPSPNLSKASAHSSRKHKADHWSRKHAENGLKEVFEDRKALEKPHGRTGSGKDDLRVREKPRKSRRLSAGEAEDAERRKRRAARKAEEASRAEEERRRQADDDERRRARRAAKQAAVDEAARLDTEIDEREAEITRLRQRGKVREAQLVRPRRDTKNTMPTFTMPSLPKALGLTNGGSSHGTTLVGSQNGAYVTNSVPTTSPTRHREGEAGREPQEEMKTKSPSSSNGEKSHHRRRHHRHRSSGDGSTRGSKDREHWTRRPSVDEVIAERPRSFLGGLKLF